MSTISTRLRRALEYAATASYNALDRTFPAKTREDIRISFLDFARNNPKLAAFVAVQLAFSGIPLLSFLAFALTIFITSLVTATVLAILAASLFTTALVGASILLALPVLLFTTFAASSLFVCGVAGFATIQWLKKRNASFGERLAAGNESKFLHGGRPNGMGVIGRPRQIDPKAGSGSSSKEDTHSGADNTSKRARNAETHHPERTANEQNKQSGRLDTADTIITGPEVFRDDLLQQSQK